MLEGEDKVGGSPVKDKVRHFKEFLDNTGIVEIKTTGRRYT